MLIWPIRLSFSLCPSVRPLDKQATNLWLILNDYKVMCMKNDDVYLQFTNYASFSLQIRERRTLMRKKKKTWLNADQRNVFCNTCLKWNVQKTFIIHLTYETAISWILLVKSYRKLKKTYELMDAAKALCCREWGQIREYKAGYTAADASGSAISLVPAARAIVFVCMCMCMCACVSANACVCVLLFLVIAAPLTH